MNMKMWVYQNTAAIPFYIHIIICNPATVDTFQDNQVPVCPLCNTPIPVKAGELPDVRVGQHIDSDCQSDPAKERRRVRFECVRAQMLWQCSFYDLVIQVYPNKTVKHYTAIRTEFLNQWPDVFESCDMCLSCHCKWISKTSPGYINAHWNYPRLFSSFFPLSPQHLHYPLSQLRSVLDIELIKWAKFLRMGTSVCKILLDNSHDVIQCTHIKQGIFPITTENHGIWWIGRGYMLGLCFLGGIEA